MSIAESHEESDGVVLIAGLVTIVGLVLVSLVAVDGPLWMGLLVGSIELAVAWRVSPPPKARPLRWVTTTVGAFTFVWAIVWALAS
jgi:hypothetical protein